MDDAPLWIATAVALILLAAIATIGLSVTRIRHRRPPLSPD
ncbi:MAG: hypothetical protein ABL886_05740 [Rhodoglobus sp.]